MFISAIVLTIISNVLYHVFQKVTPSNVNPMLALAVTYLVAAVICLALLPAFPLTTGLWASIKQLNWASYGLAAAVVGLELGFLLAYRAGWDISLASLVSNVTVSMILLPIGLLLFKEKIAPVNSVGIGVCILGLFLVNWK